MITNKICARLKIINEGIYNSSRSHTWKQICAKRKGTQLIDITYNITCERLQMQTLHTKSYS